MTIDITDHVLVPVATVEDARETAKLLRSYDVGTVTVLHVVEKGDGVPDKTPVEQSEAVAEQAFGSFRAFVPEIETQLAYRRDVVDAIVDVASEVGATAIVFRPRGGSRIVSFLSGDRTLKLVTNAECPVIALSETDEE